MHLMPLQVLCGKMRNIKTTVNSSPLRSPHTVWFDDVR